MIVFALRTKERRETGRNDLFKSRLDLILDTVRYDAGRVGPLLRI
ncbi:MAG: hypothetical protein ACLPTZ_18325 [Beijerinckiaceae bacterium]